MLPIIKWTGSKRHVIKELIKLTPEYENYYDPFLGGGTFTYYNKNCRLSDINPHLIGLWNIVKNNPKRLLEQYTFHWNNLKQTGKTYYYNLRAEFNNDQDLYKFFL